MTGSARQTSEQPAARGGRDLVLLTPTHPRDVGRFRLLRESLRQFEVDAPHVVVLNPRDDAERYRLAGDRGIEFLSVADVLPERLVRIACSTRRRRDPRYWLCGDWRVGGHLAGWALQQLIKLGAAKRLGPNVTLACLDSDLFLLQPLPSTTFQDLDGTSRLFELLDDEAEMLSWELRAMAYLGVQPQGARVRRHTFEPNVVDGEVALALLSFIEAKSGAAWYEALLRESLTEYATYGVFARHVMEDPPVVPSAPVPVREIRYAARRDQVWPVGERSELEVFGMVRSALGIPVESYAASVRQAWVG